MTTATGKSNIRIEHLQGHSDLSPSLCVPALQGTFPRTQQFRGEVPQD